MLPLVGVVTRLVAALVAVPMLTATGCGSASDPSPESTVPGLVPASGSPSPSTVAPADPAAEVLAVYRAMWQAYDLAGQPPRADPDHPDLERYASGDALEMLTGLLADFERDGLVFQGELVLAPEVTDLSPERAPTSARVEDCVDSSRWELERTDGGAYEDPPGGRQQILADVEKVEEGWTVTALAIGSVGSC